MTHHQTNKNIAFIADADGAGAAANSPSFRPHAGNMGVSVYAKATQPGLGWVERREADSHITGTEVWNRITDQIAMTANTEQPFFIGGPVNVVRFSFNNNNSTAGTYRVDFVEGGVRSL